VNHSEGGGVPGSAPCLTGSAGRHSGFRADGHLDAFLTVAAVVIRDAVPIQAPAPASVVPSVSVCGVGAGSLGFLHASGVSRDGGNVVEVFWHLLTGMVLSVLLMLARV